VHSRGDLRGHGLGAAANGPKEVGGGVMPERTNSGGLEHERALSGRE
jgi:hypothetical protein